MAQKITVEEAQRLCILAFSRSGMSEEQSDSVARSLIEAEVQGKPGVGLNQLFNYLDALREGRVDGNAEPSVTRPAPTLFRVDAQGGFPHTGVDRAFNEFIEVARTQGMAALGLKNGFTCGELGYFVRRLAKERLLGLAVANGGPALLASSGSTTPVFCTNPLAFAVPRNQAPPLVIDQSSSATAFVNLKCAAENGTPIPRGWALDSSGKPSTDPKEALKGVLLAFGGARGANIALMVELLAAGVTGANWSREAPSFVTGDECPGVGLLILALHADLLLGDDSVERIDAYLSLIQSDHQTYIPGQKRGEEAKCRIHDGLSIPESLLERMKTVAENSGEND